jgi:hypothetical protein
VEKIIDACEEAIRMGEVDKSGQNTQLKLDICGIERRDPLLQLHRLRSEAPPYHSLKGLVWGANSPASHLMSQAAFRSSTMDVENRGLRYDAVHI